MPALTVLPVGEIADRIVTTVHPSLRELGPVAEGVTRVARDGRVIGFCPDRLTRLEIPGSSTGFGTRWIDYESAGAAADARDHARAVVRAAPTPEAAYEALLRWYEAE